VGGHPPPPSPPLWHPKGCLIICLAQRRQVPEIMNGPSWRFRISRAVGSLVTTCELILFL
jgi:hypothetical protein